jgi:3D (Asp-Asp-Asp) domain-containing protein
MRDLDRDELQINAIAAMTAAEVEIGLLRFGMKLVESLPDELRQLATAKGRAKVKPQCAPTKRRFFLQPVPLMVIGMFLGVISSTLSLVSFWRESEYRILFFEPGIELKREPLPAEASMANTNLEARGYIDASYRILPQGTRIRLEGEAYSGEYVAVAETAHTTSKSRRTKKRPLKVTALAHALTLKDDTKTSPVAPQLFTATAYSLRDCASSGQMVAHGLIAADRRVFPLGTRVRLEAGMYSGEYLVTDLGGSVRGRKIDIWMPMMIEATRFSRPVKLTILKSGGAKATTTRTSR